jgi:aldose 1-epimerase
VAFGFHPYLRLPDVARPDWHVELPAIERLELDATAIPTGVARPVAPDAGALGTRTFDDGFAGVPEGAAFGLAGGGRRVTVRFDDGYPVAQVFAPATNDVVCFEPMTAPTNALVTGDRLTLVPPGASYAAAFSIAVEAA